MLLESYHKIISLNLILSKLEIPLLLLYQHSSVPQIVYNANQTALMFSSASLVKMDMLSIININVNLVHPSARNASSVDFIKANLSIGIKCQNLIQRKLNLINWILVQNTQLCVLFVQLGFL